MTADTFSNTLGFLIMGVGNDNNTWGGNCSTSVFQIFEDAIANALTNAVTGGTLDLSGSPPPAAPSQARYAALIFTGTLGSNQTIQVPNLQKFWFVQNATAGAFTLKIKTPSGSASTAIPQNSGWQVVYCDGSNNIVVHPFNTNQIQMPDGSVGAPPYSNVNEPNSGFRRAGTQDWRFVINGADVLQITGTGAGTPSVVNVLSPNALQIAGVQVIPPGAEIDYDGLTEPTGWYFPVGQTKNRVTDANLFNALSPNSVNGVAITGNTHTTTTIDNLSVDLRNMGLLGAFVEGTGITAGTTITAITASTITITPAATGTATGVALRVSVYGLGDGSTTFQLPDRRGTTTFTRDDLNGTARNILTGPVVGSVTGNRLNQFGGEQIHTLTTAEAPSGLITLNFSDPGHHHTYQFESALNQCMSNSPCGSLVDNAQTTGNTGNSTTGISASLTDHGGNVAHNNIPPATIVNRLIKR